MKLPFIDVLQSFCFARATKHTIKPEAVKVINKAGA